MASHRENRGLTSPFFLVGCGILAATLVIGVAVFLGSRDAIEPLRCDAGMVAHGPRCCGEGQHLSGAACVGKPRSCGALHVVTSVGCEPIDAALRVTVAGRHLRIGPGDWEAQGVVVPREIDVAAFEMDAFEVTEGRWAECAKAGVCAARGADAERGVPVAQVTFDEAETFCKWAGGRLPTRDELTVAISGDGSRRYPWGDTGAVCRRAAWGLLAGPCAEGGAGPDVVGSHPAGKSETNAYDLAGNVAEWASGPDATTFALGGSFEDSGASALRGWNHKPLPKSTRSKAVGFRCVYTPKT